MKRLVLMTLTCTVAIFLAVGLGCGSDDGDDGEAEDTKVADKDVKVEDKDVATVDTPNVDVPTVDVPNVETPTGSATFKGFVASFGSNPEKNEPGVTVEIVDDETGAGTGTTQVTDGEGWVTFEDMPVGGLVGFKCTKADHKETYQFHIKSDVADEKLWIVPNSIYNFAIGLAGLKVTDGMGTLAGAVYFLDGDEEVPVEGAIITSDPPTDDVRYMDGDNGLPTTPDKQACTHVKHGRFLATNLEPGATTVIASVNGVEVGNVIIPVVPDSIAIGNIYVTTDTNPSDPASCP